LTHTTNDLMGLNGGCGRGDERIIMKGVLGFWEKRTCTNYLRQIKCGTVWKKAGGGLSVIKVKKQIQGEEVFVTQGRGRSFNKG